MSPREPEPTILPARRDELLELATRLGYTFDDLRLLERALCHSSTFHEGKANYERLEFLGDAVLGFLVADALYHHEPEIPVGQLTDRRAQFVSRPPLAEVARRLRLGTLLVGGRGLREQDRESRRILADLTEAVLAAIYVDGGIGPARRFVRDHILRDFDRGTPAPPERDPKSRLLHHVQVHHHDQPTYTLVRSEGPDHERVFEVTVELAGRALGTGTGTTKQAAEKAAARRALERLEAERAAEADRPG